MVLEKTLESPLDYKEIQPVIPKGDQSWVFIGRTDAEKDGRQMKKCAMVDEIRLDSTADLTDMHLRRSNQSILKDISPEISLEGMMLKLKLQYFGHLMRRVDSLEKTLMLGGIRGRRKRR